MLSLNMPEEEENTGPSVESEDMEERILARRLRIEKRVEDQKKLLKGDEPDEGAVELSKSRKQIEVSRQRITKLMRDGNELLSNIRVAGDARDNARRSEEDEIRRHRRERMEVEAKTSLERFDEITKKWESSLQKDIPQELHEMLQQQKDACQNMIEEKNKLINDLQLELKAKDDLYVKDLKKQAESIDLLIERMDEQVRTMTKTYREELTQIEKAFVAQRDDLMEQQNGQWEQMMQMIRDKQIDYLDARQKRVDDFEAQLQHLRIQHAEEYNALKIKLETDVQTLEQQLQMMKATYQLNLEKLEYNLQVLKKRDEENSITKSQQKRKITRLQDVLNNLKIKAAKQEKQYRSENEQLTEDYKRVTEQFRDLQKKSKHLLGADSKKFRDIWMMNEEELKSLSHRLIEGDRIITEQQLGLEFTPPTLDFMANVGPLGPDQEKSNAVMATAVVQEVLSKAAEPGKDPDLEAIKKGGVTVRSLGPTAVKAILELLCNEGSFLIESKLQKLLQPLDKDERFLMRLDAVFSALGIATEEDIDQLLPYFIESIGVGSLSSEPSKTEDFISYHPVVEEEIAMKSVKKEETNDSLMTSSDTKRELAARLAEETLGVDETLGEDKTLAPGEQEGETQEQTTEPTSSSVQIIHPTCANKAVKSFVNEFHRAERERQQHIMGAQFTLSGLEERDDEGDASYWDSYKVSLVSGDKEKMWDALIESFDKYSGLLTNRSNLITEVDAMRLQNAELRHLLQQYVGSKVNHELEVPPTRIMQIDRV